jgi:transcriptional regulator with XRE-family HTH domain
MVLSMSLTSSEVWLRVELGNWERRGQLTGLAHNTVARLERGKIKNPSWEVIQKLAEALGVPTDQLRDPPPPGKGEASSGEVGGAPSVPSELPRVDQA